MGIGDQVPINFLALEDAAKAVRTTLNVPIMKWNDWVDIASKTLDSKNIIRVATQFLHNLGEIVYFEEPGIDNVVILDSQWLTEVFSSVVSAKYDPKYGMSGDIKRGIHLKFSLIIIGILHHKDLELIWRSNPEKPSLNFSPGFHPFLLSVLEKFEVLHRLSGSAINNIEISDQNFSLDQLDQLKNNLSQIEATENQGRSLIPCLLPEEPPSQETQDKFWPPNDEGLSTQLGRIYQFEFVPIGFFSRIMVRLLHSKWIPLIFWANGIILYKDCLFKLEFDPQTFKIEITVRGDAAANLMGSLLESIDTLISDWLKNVDYAVYVPCNFCTSKKIDPPHKFNLAVSIIFLLKIGL